MAANDVGIRDHGRPGAFPLVRQVSVFLENRPGQLLRLTQAFEDQEIKILGLSQMDVGRLRDRPAGVRQDGSRP